MTRLGVIWTGSELSSNNSDQTNSLTTSASGAFSLPEFTPRLESLRKPARPLDLVVSAIRPVAVAPGGQSEVTDMSYP